MSGPPSSRWRPDVSGRADGAAPDNGKEVAGTQIYTWQATVAR